MHWWLIYLLLGGFAGLFAGLLGVGGGLTVVPLLLMIFAAQDLPEAHLMQLALGTAMAGIVFTSISSLRAHHLHAAVDWQVVRRIAPGIVAGTLLGTALAGQLHSRALAIFFALFAYAAATQLLLNVRPKPTRELPGKAGMTACAAWSRQAAGCSWCRFWRFAMFRCTARSERLPQSAFRSPWPARSATS